MSTNPDNAVGTNAAYGGRTSVNAFNDDLAAYSRGVMSGWACSPSSGMKVALGGESGIRDVAVAEDNAGNKTSINNISGAPIEVTIEAAPAANSRIDAIVAYVDNPPQGSDTIADNYEACGLIVVAGTASSTPVEPSDGAIRSAITADGASGATAYYAVLAYATVASGTTDITAGDIQAGSNAAISSQNVDSTTFRNWYGTKQTGNQTIPANGTTILTADISSVPIDWVVEATIYYWWRCDTRNQALRATLKIGDAEATGQWMRSSMEGGAYDVQTASVVSVAKKASNWSSNSVVARLDNTGGSNTVVKDGRMWLTVFAHPGDLTIVS